MRSGINRIRYQINIRIICTVFLIIFLNSIILSNVSAKHIEFEVKEFEEKMIIPNNNYRSYDITFVEGKELEVVFLLQEKEGLPFDVWFVNDDNYLLLTSGAQFLFFFDGSEQKTSYAKKIVTLNEYGEYKMVITNYQANQTIDVELKGEMRTFGLKSEKSSSENEDLLIIQYFLFIIVIILVIIITVLSIKFQKYKNLKDKNSYKTSSKNSKDYNTKRFKEKETHKSSSKKKKDKKSKKTKSEVTEKTSLKNVKNSHITNNFCGYCGESIDTPFCKHCGKKN
jgi:hypothetical protein